MPDPNFLTPEEVIARYRGQVSDGTLRNWRCLRIGPSFLKIGKAILYPSGELDRWERSILVACKPTRELPREETAPPESQRGGSFGPRGVG
ncbi:helix-turn-helix domain-containing protein [Mesorhizobium sp. M1338]|uniref:DNA-binding protein n=1 Tax=unclassified Mesorhizobium TaxID=325217 RepID=UPI0033394FA0